MSEGAPTINGTDTGHTQSMASDRAIQANGAAAPAPLPSTETLPPAIEDFDAMVNSEVKTFVNMSEEIGGLVAEQVKSSCLPRPGTKPRIDCCSNEGRCGASILCSSTKVPHHNDKVQETRRQITCVHGDIEGIAIDDGSGQRHQRS